VGEASIQLKRHYRELSPEEADEVVNAVADLVVNYLKGRRKESTQIETKQEVNRERNGNQPTEYC